MALGSRGDVVLPAEGGRRLALVLEQAAQYEYWGLTVPMTVTGICLAVFLSRIIVLCSLQRRAELMLVAIGYAWAMAVAWIWLYAWLKSEAFS